MPEPMADNDFMWLMLMGYVENREDARKLMLVQSFYKNVPQEISEESLSRYPEGKRGYGFGDLALAAIRSGNVESTLSVITVNKARKDRVAWLGYADDTPAMQSRMEALLCEALLCDDEDEREQIRQEASKVYDETEIRKNPKVGWEDFFATNDYAEKIRILQDLYNGLLTPEEMMSFLDVADEEKEAVMQLIHHLEADRCG